MSDSDVNRNRERVDLTRRRSFSQLLGGLIVTVDEARGLRHCSLAGLENLERTKFEKLVPQISREFNLFIRKKNLVAKNRKTGETNTLFEIGNEVTAAFNMMNHKNTIADITRAFSESTNRSEEEGFLIVKKLVLDLVNLQVCTFSNPVED